VLRDSKISRLGTKVIYGAFGRILEKMELGESGSVQGSPASSRYERE
jgi:hypothetical protein